MRPNHRIAAALLAVQLLAPACKEKGPQPEAGAATPGKRPVIDGGRTEVMIDPANAESLYLAGQQEFVAGEFDKAAEHFRQAVRLKPDARTWHALGDAQLAQARFADASEAFRAALALDPKKRMSWMRLGRCLINTGRSAEAVQVYGKAIELDGRDAVAWREQGEALLAGERVAEAIARIEKAAELDAEGRAGDLKLVGQLWARHGELPKAIESLRKSAALHPDAGIYGELADALVRTGDLPAARDAFREAAKIDKADPFYWEIVGELEAKLGNAAAAREAFEASLAVKARPAPHVGLGRMALGEGKADEARKRLDSALAAATGEDATEARELARFAAELGDWTVAEKLLAMLAEEEEAAREAALWLELAAARSELKLAQKVEEACARAKALLPKDDRSACPPSKPAAVGAR